MDYTGPFTSQIIIPCWFAGNGNKRREKRGEDENSILIVEVAKVRQAECVNRRQVALGGNHGRLGRFPRGKPFLPRFRATFPRALPACPRTVLRCTVLGPTRWSG